MTFDTANGKFNASEGFAKFISESPTGLAPFEEESAFLLDEFENASPNQLEEFEETIETISLSEPVGERSQEGEEEVREDETPDEDSQSFEDVASGEEETEDIETASEESETESLVGEEIVREKFPEEAGRIPQSVIGFVCRHAVDLSSIMDSHGRMIGRSWIHLIDFPCAGMVKPSWVEHAINKGAEGVFVVACYPGTCHHRRGACVIHGRWNGLRQPSLSENIDRKRLTLIFSNVIEREEFIEKLENFLQDIPAYSMDD